MSTPIDASLRITLEEILWVLFALAVGTLFLFQVPGFHYDEVWIAQLGARIMREPGFWSLEGMNRYTFPVVSYVLAVLFKLARAPSLEGARIFYAVLNTLSFLLFYQWLKKWTVGKAATRTFSLLWVTLPLSVVNQRFFLEVTTFFSFFVALALWGFSEGARTETRRASFFWLGLGILSLWLGVITHVLFFTFLLALLMTIWLEQPSLFSEKRWKKVLTLLLVPLFLFFLQMVFRVSTRDEAMKAAVLCIGLGFFLIGVWRDWATAKGFLVCRKWLVYGLTAASLVGFFFYFLFQLSGPWPISQVTGQLFFLLWVPGFLMLAVSCRLLLLSGRETSWLFRFLRTGWAVQVACIPFSVFKPTSARYWELPLLWMLLWIAVGFTEIRKQTQFRFWMSLFLLGCGLNGLFLGRFYFLQILTQGASSTPYQWLWVRDSAAYYRPGVQVYEALRASGKICSRDSLLVDQQRSEFVIQVYRQWAQESGKERVCTVEHDPISFWIGRPEWIQEQEYQLGKKLRVVEVQPSWGDLAIYGLVR